MTVQVHSGLSLDVVAHYLQRAFNVHESETFKLKFLLGVWSAVVSLCCFNVQCCKGLNTRIFSSNLNRFLIFFLQPKSS